MLMADDGPDYRPANEFLVAGDYSDNMCFDLDAFCDMLAESSDPSQNRLEGESRNNVFGGDPPNVSGDNKQIQFDFDGVCQIASSSQVGAIESQNEISCRSRGVAVDAETSPTINENFSPSQPKVETDFKFQCLEANVLSEYSLPYPWMGTSGVNVFENLSGESFKTLGVPKIENPTVINVGMPANSAPENCSIYSENSGSGCKAGWENSSTNACLSTDSYNSDSSRQFFYSFGQNEDKDMYSIKEEDEGQFNDLKNLNSRIINGPKVERAAESLNVASFISNLNAERFFIGSEVDESITSDREWDNSLHNFSNLQSRQDEVNDVEVLGLHYLQSQCLFRDDSGSIKMGRGSNLTVSPYLSNISLQAGQNDDELVSQYQDEDDSDLCIIEDLSDPAYCDISLPNGKSAFSRGSTFSNPIYHKPVVGMRSKSSERFVFSVAMQDLAQPTSEAIPPDGLLAVPLLRHQRIALSWMIQKETASYHCSGGILADDQGLGKTVSTIALILKERSPCSSTIKVEAKQSELETLNLDDDEDDDAPKAIIPKLESDSCQFNGALVKGRSIQQRKGRPAAGTLIVCPTSVLRQWSEELHNKVTSKANLSVLMYHGSNRTKDPFELAKYDVVITTYSIVSMEVPKQPLVDEDCDESGKQGDVASMGFSSSKKRKYPLSSDEGCLKGKRGMDGELFEAIARPLARVLWFRVVLDEAQSIKNHKTQVARACWGLRAKRRWCLSGTPIQNAVDDLYSYFRFLRYEPFAVYKSFCSKIKVPIHRNPNNGYKMLQAVLKTIMLRRTKGTLLDGKPIINLPPKTVELMKVDFTDEERDFYCRLEADSRAQFAEYAAAGTVKQNYVNILLMLLRLRQACDHPLLVSGYNSSSDWRSSLDMAKKLSREKLVFLLNCLETSLAICGLCNDSPEDAVVASCGHVFCNQCISEQLIGDANQCPMTNCKDRLNSSSLFSRTTLRGVLSDQPGLENFSNQSTCELVEKLDQCSSNSSYDSSKIRAVVEVLQSLSRGGGCVVGAVEKSGSYLQNSSDYSLGESQCDSLNIRDSSTKKMSSDLTIGVGEKAIIFSQWTRMLDLLEVCLKDTSISYRRLDGTMSVVARDKAVKDFNTLPEVSVMIMSLKAASLGLNMVAACHVLLLDLWWNPTTEDQAIDRAHRIGQTRPVKVLRLTVKDTVEDRILALQEKKREMVASAFGEDETGARQTRLTVDDLKFLFS